MGFCLETNDGGDNKDLPLNAVCFAKVISHKQHVMLIAMLSSLIFTFFKNIKICPDWCGSVDGVSFLKPKGCWFNS